LNLDTHMDTAHAHPLATILTQHHDRITGNTLHDSQSTSHIIGVVLPQEIVVEILVQAWLDIHEHHSHLFTRLSLVCRDWRAILLDFAMKHVFIHTVDDLLLYISLFRELCHIQSIEDIPLSSFKARTISADPQWLRVMKQPLHSSYTTLDDSDEEGEPSIHVARLHKGLQSLTSIGFPVRSPMFVDAQRLAIVYSDNNDIGFDTRTLDWIDAAPSLVELEVPSDFRVPSFLHKLGNTAPSILHLVIRPSELPLRHQTWCAEFNLLFPNVHTIEMYPPTSLRFFTKQLPHTVTKIIFNALPEPGACSDIRSWELDKAIEEEDLFEEGSHFQQNGSIVVRTSPGDVHGWDTAIKAAKQKLIIIGREVVYF
jgi:hypothetical protein